MDEIELRRLTDTNGVRTRQLVPLSALIHPSILCDLCYEVIEGPWLRCCNCTGESPRLSWPSVPLTRHTLRSSLARPVRFVRGKGGA